MRHSCRRIAPWNQRQTNNRAGKRETERHSLRGTNAAGPPHINHIDQQYRNKADCPDQRQESAKLPFGDRPFVSLHQRECSQPESDCKDRRRRREWRKLQI